MTKKKEELEPIVTTDAQGKKHHILRAEAGMYGLQMSPHIQRHRPLRCGRCGSRNFHVIVIPEGDQSQFARVTGALCRCNAYYEMGSDGRLKHLGKPTQEFGGQNGSLQ